MIPGLVTTIIPVYNRPEMIVRAVQSVLDQTYRPVEIIIVNDGSTDSTGQVVDELSRQHPEEIRILHTPNGGPGLAREAGRLRANGEFIQYLDSDDWLLPNKFFDQVAALCSHPDCGIAYGITRLVNEAGHILAEPSKDTGVIREHLFPALLVNRWWHTHTPLYRRDVSDAAGAWPKQRPEDWDLEARMGALGVKLVYCGSVVSCHLDHDSPNRVTKGSQLAYLRDEAWFMPRLYACACKAGVPLTAPEMYHFSRWAFMRARDLGAEGEGEAAWDLLNLARRTCTTNPMSMRFAAVLARLFGWKVVGKLAMIIDHTRSSIRN